MRQNTKTDNTAEHTRCATALALLIGVLMLAGCGDAPGSVDDARSLSAALAAAAPGDAIDLGEVVITGSFVVPEGVTLRGAGVQSTRIEASGGGALVIRGGSVEDLTVHVPIEAGAVAAVTIADGANVNLSRVTLDVDAGMGLAASGVDSLSLTDVAILGPLTDDLADDLEASTLDPSTIAVTGLLIGDANVTFERVDVRDFAGFGAVFRDVEGIWRDGEVSGNLGTGTLVEASTLELVDVVIRDGRKSSFAGSLNLGIALAATQGSDLRTSGVQVAGNDGFGFLQDASVSQHLGLRVFANDGPGAWVQNSPGATADVPAMVVSGSVFRANSRMGIGGFDAGGILVDGTVIAETIAAPGLSTELTLVVESDGLQGTAAGAGVFVVSDSVVYGSGRAAVLLADGASGTSDGGGVVLCGADQIDGDRWTCSTTDDGLVSCERTSGPAVIDSWECDDADGRVVCSTSDPALAAAEPLHDPGSTMSEPRPDDDACATSLSALLDREGFSLGYEVSPTRQVVPPTAARWTCEGTSPRTCELSAAADRERRSPDNPTWVNGAGWTCASVDDTRTCTFDGVGLVARAGADVAGLAAGVTVLDAAQVTRDLRLAETEAADGGRFATETPLLTGVIGENGVLNARAVIGENGVVNASGVVTNGVVGENGYQ